MPDDGFPGIEDVADAARDARDLGKAQLVKLGSFIRDQRKAAEMSLRDLASRSDVSNPYLSQVERGLHEPSVRVLRSIAKALNISAETLMVQAGLIDGAGPDQPPPSVATAIMADDRLTDEQKSALLAVYRSYIARDD